MNYNLIQFQQYSVKISQSIKLAIL